MFNNRKFQVTVLITAVLLYFGLPAGTIAFAQLVDNAAILDSTVLIEKADLPVGDTIATPLAVDGTISQITYTIDTTNHTDPAVLIVGKMEYSLDDGRTWQFLCGFTRHGGIDPIADSKEASVVCNSGVPLVKPQFRGSINIKGKSLLTSSTLKGK